MPLRIELKPHEKLFLGGAVVVNGDNRCQLTILNDVALLREKEILTDDAANTPCKRIYLAIQLMYMDPAKLALYQEHYWTLVRELLAAAPSAYTLVTTMSAQIMAGQYYQAMKTAQELINYERKLVAHAQQSD